MTDAGRSRFISARKVELLLAVLLSRSDQVVPADQLITEIWGEHVPRRATAALHVYVSQLRKFLGHDGRCDSPIVTRPPGYLVRIGSDELDLRDFERLVHQGRAFSRSRHHEDASAAFSAALNLWYGPVLGDLRDGPVLNSLATWLEEAQLECIEMQIDTDLRLGRHRELVGRLYALTAEHPMREAFYRQLMLALYRSDWRADALSVYQLAWETLRDELGLEPCRALRDLQRAILAADEVLDVPIAV